MPRNIAVGKAAVGPANTSNSKTVAVLTPQKELAAANTKISGFKSCLKPETPLYLVRSY